MPKSGSLPVPTEPALAGSKPEGRLRLRTTKPIRVSRSRLLYADPQLFHAPSLTPARWSSPDSCAFSAGLPGMARMPRAMSPRASSRRSRRRSSASR